MISYKDAVRAVYSWQYRNSDTDGELPVMSPGFYELLVHLYKKADGSNRRIISNGWPHVAQAVKDWDNAGDFGNDLFREHKIGRFKDPDV